MATLAPVVVPAAGLTSAMGPTAAGGDEFAVSSGDTLIYFNGHTVAITVTLVAVALTANVIGAFPVAITNRAFAIPPGETLRIPVSGETLNAYVNATTRRVAVTYAAHNAALKVDLLRRG